MNMKHIDQMGVFLIAALLMYFPGIAAFRPSMHPNDVPPLTVKTNRRPLLPASICTSLTSEYVRLSPLISTTQGSSSCSSGTTKSTLVASSRNVTVKPTPTLRRKWGVDNEQDREYWFDSRIHVFGNSGFWGAFHAAVAPLSTHWIDIVAYNGVDIRQRVRTMSKRFCYSVIVSQSC